MPIANDVFHAVESHAVYVDGTERPVRVRDGGK